MELVIMVTALVASVHCDTTTISPDQVAMRQKRGWSYENIADQSQNSWNSSPTPLPPPIPPVDHGWERPPDKWWNPPQSSSNWWNDRPPKPSSGWGNSVSWERRPRPPPMSSGGWGNSRPPSGSGWVCCKTFQSTWTRPSWPSSSSSSGWNQPSYPSSSSSSSSFWRALQSSSDHDSTDIRYRNWYEPPYPNNYKGSWSWGASDGRFYHYNSDGFKPSPPYFHKGLVID